MRLLPRADGAVAVYLDARTAMVPMHARPLHARGKDLAECRHDLRAMLDAILHVPELWMLEQIGPADRRIPSSSWR